MLKAFAIIHQPDHHRRNGVSDISAVIYSADLGAARDYAVSEANELRSLNEGEFHVIGISIDSTEEEAKASDGIVNIVQVSSRGLWRIAIAQFTGFASSDIPDGPTNLQSVKWTFLED